MANPDHLAILQEALDKDDISIWNQWREVNRFLRPDLGKADLSKADLSNANLNNTYLGDANLSEADLRNTNLQLAELTDANLSGAYLWNARMEKSRLWRAKLEGAQIGEAKLDHANLRSANLSEAELPRTSLRLVNLWETELRDADFTEAICGVTLFRDVDLSQAKNLDKVIHKGPSAIGIDTLYRSKGDIPEVFLRGCGVPDTMIAFARDLVLAERPIDFYSCFISYSHADKEFARQLHDRLQGEGIRCWLDEKQMIPGDDIYEEVQRGIRYWDKVLLVCSKASLNSWWVDLEINTAFSKEWELFKEREGGRQITALIPLDLDGYLFSDEYRSGKKEKLRSRLAADFKGWKSDNDIFVEGVAQVIKALQTEGRKEDPPPPKL